MTVSPSLRAVYAGGIALGIVLLTAVAFAPPLPAGAPIDPSRIVITEPGDQHLPRLAITAARLLPFARQFEWGTQTERQYGYSAPLDLPLGRNLGVFVPFIGAEARLFVNNIAVGSAQPSAYFGPGAGDHALLARIPANFLKPVYNRIDIVAAPDLRGMGLRQIYLADYATLAAAAQRVTAWQTAVQRAGLGAALVGLLCSALGILLRRRSWLHLSLAPLALMTLAFGTPLAAPGIAILGALLGLLAAGGLRARPAAKSAAVFNGMLLAALASASAAALLAFGGVMPPVSTWLIGLANLGQLPLLAAGLPLLLGFDALALRRDVTAARLNATEQAANARKAEGALQDEIRSRAIVEERQRFVRDMHDGIGGQMQSLLMRLRMRKIAIADVESEVAAGLVDLRLVADSLDHVGNDLASALATFHTRARQQLDAADMRLIWEQTGDCSQVRLDPRAILSIYRILQEALTNCVRHARARQVTVSIKVNCPVRGALLHIQFVDDGTGLTAPLRSGGRGVSNMIERASRLGGTLTVVNAPDQSGVVIDLVLPHSLAAPS